MTTVSTQIPLSSAQIIDMSKVKLMHASEMPDGLYQQFVEAQEKFLEARYTSLPDTSNHPAYQSYATVQVNGQTVAKIDNNGFVESTNSHSADIRRAIASINSENGGPDLAAQRAENIAAALGGKVVISDTAMSQQQYNATSLVTPTVDYTAMQNDPLYETLLKTKQARTEYVAQQMGQDMAEEASSTEQMKTTDETSTNKFLEYMEMTPEERYIMQALAHRGYTQEEFDMLPLEEQEKIMKEIREELREQTALQTESGQTGFDTTDATTAKQDIVTQLITINKLLDKQAELENKQS